MKTDDLIRLMAEDRQRPVRLPRRVAAAMAAGGLLALLLLLVTVGPRPGLAAALAGWRVELKIAATALMLAAMRVNSFAVTTAYTKTEPVQVALFGALLLGDQLGWPKFAAIVFATIGVIVVSWMPGENSTAAGLRPAVLGITAGAFFALSAIGFRGAILALPEGGFMIRATTILALGLFLQTVILTLYMLVADRRALMMSLRNWRRSLSAGFLGAAASQCWFIGFSLTSAANVRTLALIEVPLAQVASRRIFSEKTSRRELLGMAMIVVGVGCLLMLSLR